MHRQTHLFSSRQGKLTKHPGLGAALVGLAAVAFPRTILSRLLFLPLTFPLSLSFYRSSSSAYIYTYIKPPDLYSHQIDLEQAVRRRMFVIDRCALPVNFAANVFNSTRGPPHSSLSSVFHLPFYTTIVAGFYDKTRSKYRSVSARDIRI